MVTIVDFKSYKREDGSIFNSLVVQGGVEAVKSQETGKMYLTAKTARVPSTFNEVTCKFLIGHQLPGKVCKVVTDPYEYAIPDTGEIISLNHHYEYIAEQEAVLNDNTVEKEVVI